VLIAADVDLAEYVKNLDDGSVQVQAWLTDDERAALEAQGYQVGQPI
jgi:acylphosphatase